MLKKFIAIKNVGRFHSSAAPGNPQLAKHTLVLGANGYGKTTICAVLRSLQTGDPAHILGRRTLGVEALPAIELLFDTGAVRFDGTVWDSPGPAIRIFDGVFVADNVHSGEVVEIEHKRNLYRVIIGDDGVRLASEDADLAVASRAKTSEISAAAKAIQPHMPTGMRLEAFLELPLVADIDNEIAEQERRVDALRQATAIRARPALSEFPVPTMPEGILDLLSKTIDDIAQGAQRLLSEHLASHGMTSGGESWIAAGIEHAGDTCPFCGQDIRDLPLISAFRAIFSAGYKTLASDIAAMKARLAEVFGEAALARLETIAGQNNAGIEFWDKYCTFAPEPRALPSELLSSSRRVRATGLSLLDRKAAAPLEVVSADAEFMAAIEAYAAATTVANAANAAIRAANALIAERKAATDAADLNAAETELLRRRAVRTRHAEAIATLCASYSNLITEKAQIDAKKEEARASLDAHTRTVVTPYERRINDYLDAFNAGFRITETRHAYPGGIATSSYQIVINGTAIDVGDGRTPANQPSFKNTLSSGDRTTLALAFFLAHLERDPALAEKIVVFDDPFNSQDSFRRRQTVHEITRIAGMCTQVLVLSHDATFLKQVWDKAPSGDRVALTIADHRARGTKIMLGDLEKACQGRTATDIDDLQTYVTSGSGTLLDIIRKMRVVLETYCRTTYPGSFLPADWLGDIVRKIREGGDGHPAQALYNELDQINSYASQYHHGENLTDVTPDQIDPTELTGFARRTLRIVNALQA